MCHGWRKRSLSRPGNQNSMRAEIDSSCIKDQRSVRVEIPSSCPGPGIAQLGGKVDPKELSLLRITDIGKNVPYDLVGSLQTTLVQGQRNSSSDSIHNPGLQQLDRTDYTWVGIGRRLAEIA